MFVKGHQPEKAMDKALLDGAFWRKVTPSIQSKGVPTRISFGHGVSLDISPSGGVMSQLSKMAHPLESALFSGRSVVNRRVRFDSRKCAAGRLATMIALTSKQDANPKKKTSCFQRRPPSR